MTENPWQFEEKAWALGYRLVAGIDEAGRGPLAGPVVASAVVLSPVTQIRGIDDSKKLTPRKRALVYEAILNSAASVAIGVVNAAQIDQINILQASLLAMRLAVENLPEIPHYLLIDGTFPIQMIIPQESLAKGDSRSISIAAASIVAKVTRDRLMEGYDLVYPEYGFSRHKGYSTHIHQEAIKRFGASPIHRRSFAGVREYL